MHGGMDVHGEMGKEQKCMGVDGICISTRVCNRLNVWAIGRCVSVLVHTCAGFNNNCMHVPTRTAPVAAVHVPLTCMARSTLLMPPPASWHAAPALAARRACSADSADEAFKSWAEGEGRHSSLFQRKGDNDASTAECARPVHRIGGDQSTECARPVHRMCSTSP